jgi:type IV secretion system protein TrbL
MNTGVIDQFLNTFTTYIDSGFGLLGGEVAFLATTLVVIDVTMAALFWAWAAEEDILAHLVKKTLYVGFFALLIGNFNGFAKIIFNSFSGLGLKAAGSGLTSDQLLQPGRIAQVGIDAGLPILQAAGSLVGFTTIFTPTSWMELAVLYSAWLVVVASFFVLDPALRYSDRVQVTTLAGFCPGAVRPVRRRRFWPSVFSATSSRGASRSSCCHRHQHVQSGSPATSRP